jgi:hypothetical protein
VNCQTNVSFKARVLSFSISVKFTVITSNNYPIISGKMGSTMEDKTLIINNQLIRFFER